MNSSNIDLTFSKMKWPIMIKIKRGFWTFFLEPVVRWLPKFCSPLRVLALKSMGAQITSPCLILPGVKVLMPWNLKMLDHSVIGAFTNIYNFAPVSIGRMTVISQNVFLCTGSHDYKHPHMPLIWAPIKIGSDCWVATDVYLAPGVEIGNGAVIGARSVVTKDIPEWMVCAGNPCKPIKPRLIKAL